MSDIQGEAKDFNIESKNQWIFSEHNIMSSKIRICNECHGEYKWPPTWQEGHFVTNRIRQVYFAVKEYERRHTPIESAKSEYEKYFISLPDRSHIHWVAGPAGYGIFLDMECNYTEFMWSITDYLKIALIPECDKSISGYETLSHELKADFIEDKVRIIPNDQELTSWMKKNISKFIRNANYDLSDLANRVQCLSNEITNLEGQKRNSINKVILWSAQLSDLGKAIEVKNQQLKRMGK
jgi:hypothetical protein